MFDRIVIASADERSARLEQAGAQLCSPRGELHRFHVAARTPADTLDGLLSHAINNQADLLAIGARRHLFARRVAMLAPCSVLMVPDGVSLSLARLLVPVDFSEASSLALSEAARIAKRAGSAVTVLAVEPEEDPWLDWHDYPERYQDTLEQFVDKAVGRGHDFDCLVEPQHSLSPSLSPDLSGTEGLRTAESIWEVAVRLRSTLIVAGTRGRTRTASILLGSVVEKVIQLSTVPVLAVKGPGAQLGLLDGLLGRLREQQQLVAS